MAEKHTWKDNVGQIFLPEDSECFWLLPTGFFHNKKLCITSPWFSHAESTWRLVKTPGITLENYVNLYLWRKMPRNPKNYTYGFSLKLKTLDNHQTTIASKYDCINSEFGCAFEHFCSLPELRYHCVSRCGLMKLCFTIEKHIPHLNSQTSITTNVLDDEYDESNSEPEEAAKAEDPKVRGIELLAENLKQLFLNGQNSDAVLQVDEREFRVHKAILVARSPVFASMFQHDMAEKKSGLVNIPDCTAKSFEVFLLYLYTGNADIMSPNNVFNLYYAADKYRVDDLKEECADYMMEILSIENFCDVIALSLRHDETKLRKEATRFFRENIKEIIKTVKWQKYMAENSIHANELLIKALSA